MSETMKLDRQAIAEMEDRFFDALNREFQDPARARKLAREHIERLNLTDREVDVEDHYFGLPFYDEEQERQLALLRVDPAGKA